MAYRIMYDTAQNHHNRSANSKVRAFVFAGLFYLIFLGMIFRFWPEGRDFMMNLIFPGGEDGAEYAIEAFAGNLQGGMDFSQALHAFGRDIIQYGKMGY